MSMNGSGGLAVKFSDVREKFGLCGYERCFTELKRMGVDLTCDESLVAFAHFESIPEEDIPVRIAGWREKGWVPRAADNGDCVVHETPNVADKATLARVPAQSDAAAEIFASDSDLVPDMDEVERFLDLVFCHANNANYVSVCGYEHDRSKKPLFKKGIRLDDPLLLDELKSLITRAAKNYSPAVFCPPIATFDSMFSATMQHLAEGIAISVECDERPREAIRQLREVLGMPTAVIASGGQRTNSETGEIEEKLHAYWRLAVPTRTAEDHAKLRDARALAAKLVGADAAAIRPCIPCAGRARGTPRTGTGLGSPTLWRPTTSRSGLISH